MMRDVCDLHDSVVIVVLSRAQIEFDEFVSIMASNMLAKDGANELDQVNHAMGPMTRCLTTLNLPSPLHRRLSCLMSRTQAPSTSAWFDVISLRTEA